MNFAPAIESPIKMAVEFLTVILMIAYAHFWSWDESRDGNTMIYGIDHGTTIII